MSLSRENKQETGQIGRMTSMDALEVIKRRLDDFQRLGWYGEIVVKVEGGRIRHVEARPVIRDYQAQ